MGFFDKLKSGLGKTRDNFNDKMNSVFSSFRKVDEELLEELEEILIMSDIGVDTSVEIISSLRERIKKEKITEEDEVKRALKEEMQKIFDETPNNLDLNSKPTVILVVGVNGVGKTTSIGKIANSLKKQGKKVMLAAADTFRAAAASQLETWGERVGVRVISHEEGSDPTSVIYDAIQAAKASDVDVLICDTAGRLQNKVNLMKELEKMSKVISREYPEATRENLLVLDATTGKNAISQAEEFSNISDITGIVLTKMDGTARGGISITITDQFDMPIKFIGLGEGLDDLITFNPKEFAEGIFNE